jgi:CO/xanthine dehydrogenase Mo-binding subunit
VPDLIGKRTPRIDGVEKVTGSAVFTSDLAFPNMLYGKSLKSPYPHARITKLDVRKAKELPGVITVITGADIPNNNSMIGISAADIGVLTSDRVRFIGDEIAAVAAVDEARAERALELIEVEYEPLPAVFTMVEALKSEAPQLHEKLPPLYVVAGDVEEGLKEADYVFEDTFETQPI